MNIAELACGPEQGEILLETPFKLIKCRILQNDRPKRLALQLTPIGIVPPVIPPPTPLADLVVNRPIVRNTKHILRFEKPPKGSGPADMPVRQYLIVQIDLARRRKRITDGIRFDHRHPEKVEQVVILGIFGAGMSVIDTAPHLRPKHQRLPG